jgi:hypothetical protein
MSRTPSITWGELRPARGEARDVHEHRAAARGHVLGRRLAEVNLRPLSHTVDYTLKHPSPVVA